MTKRDRYLAALRNEAVNEMVWAPNFDYWLWVNRAEGTLPARYEGMSGDDIVRAIGATIWRRAAGCRAVVDESVRVREWAEGDSAWVVERSTPVGTVREVRSRAEGRHRTKATTEHEIKGVEDIRVMLYIVEATHIEPDYEPAEAALAQVGDDGIVLHQYWCVPFMQFAKMDAGYVNGFYLWMDEREKVDELIRAYERLFLEGYRVLAAGPADVISTGDNMDGAMISPPIFREYAIPFYGAAAEIVHAGGKIFQGHWCGRTESLLPLTPGCGLDGVEAIVTKPMADVTLEDALEMLGGQVVLQGGIPAVLACEQGGSREQFERYVRDVILPLRGRRGFVLGMSDNVPPDADFSRIELVADLIAAGGS